MLDNKYASSTYPDKAVVENGVKLCTDLLSQKKDNTALLAKMVAMEDEFLDLSEDIYKDEMKTIPKPMDATRKSTLWRLSADLHISQISESYIY